MVIEEIYAVYINWKLIKKPKSIQVEANEIYDGKDKISVLAYGAKTTKFLDENDDICAEIVFHPLQKRDDINIRIIGLQRDELTDEISPLDVHYVTRGRITFMKNVNERKLYYMHNSDTNETRLLSLTLDQVGLLDFLFRNNYLSTDISFKIADISNPQVISESEWYDYIGE